MAKSGRLELRDNIYEHYRSIFNHCNVIGQQSNWIRWKKRKIRSTKSFNSFWLATDTVTRPAAQSLCDSWATCKFHKKQTVHVLRARCRGGCSISSKGHSPYLAWVRILQQDLWAIFSDSSSTMQEYSEATIIMLSCIVQVQWNQQTGDRALTKHLLVSVHNLVHSNFITFSTPVKSTKTFSA